MFTGLIETIGTLSRQENHAGGQTFWIAARFSSGELEQGESIAVDGICITVEDFRGNGFQFTASRETLERSTLGEKNTGEKAHLERALRLGDRLGGHLVQGHVDGVGTVLNLLRHGSGADLTISIPENLDKYMVEKGSLSVQGVSLTIARRGMSQATFSLIPETLRRTYLGDLKYGAHLNLEVDLFAKYVEEYIGQKSSSIDEQKLRNWGF